MVLYTSYIVALNSHVVHYYNGVVGLSLAHNVKCIESDSHSAIYTMHTGHCQCYDEFKTIQPNGSNLYTN